MSRSQVESSSTLAQRPQHDSPGDLDKTTSETPIVSFELEEPDRPLRAPWWRRTAGMLGRRFPRARRVLLYLNGPRPPTFLHAPTSLLQRIPPHFAAEDNIRRWTRPLTSLWIFFPFVAAYLIGLAFLTRASWFLTPAESIIGCTATYWPDEITCGVGGLDCSPFSNSSFQFRCPAQCSTVILSNKQPVGAEEVGFVPFVVGGGDAEGTYRGDSFLCAAAIHAGVLSEKKGGCATVNLVGSFSNFLASSAHGIDSTAFPSEFPLSLRFTPSASQAHCADLHNEALIFNVVITVILFLVLRPPPSVLFWSLVCLGYWHVSLFADPRNIPINVEPAFSDFLPLLFVCYAIWRVSHRYCFQPFSKLPIERMLWYLPPFWVGILWKLTFEKLPVDRLLASDIRARSGALATVIVVSLVVLAGIVNQLRIMRKTGWLLYYAWRYAVVGLTIVVFAFLPGLVFRLHHYITALLLLPITAFPTRISLLAQGLCLGMFLAGVAKFKFDSILQTVDVVRRDAPLGSSLPVFLTSSTTWDSSIPLANQTVRWDTYPNTDEGWNGFSLVVDDVQVYVGTALSYSLATLDPTIAHFFRISFQRDHVSGDSTQAATLWPNGTWVNPAPGPA